jgi:5-aminolevulinate synthase
MVCAAAVASVRHLKASALERKTHGERIAQLKEELRAARIPILRTPGHMVPVMVRDSFRCKEIADRLLTHYKIYVQPINFPTVPKGTERLRVTPTAAHSPEMVSEFVRSLRHAWTECGLPDAES